MSINLKYILKRNKIDMEAFFLKNQIENYEQLCEHCKNVDIIPITKVEYDLLVKKEEKPKEVKIEKPKQRKKSTRASSKTQTRQKRRSSSKKVNNT